MRIIIGIFMNKFFSSLGAAILVSGSLLLISGHTFAIFSPKILAFNTTVGEREVVQFNVTPEDFTGKITCIQDVEDLGDGVSSVAKYSFPRLFPVSYTIWQGSAPLNADTISYTITSSPRTDFLFTSLDINRQPVCSNLINSLFTDVKMNYQINGTQLVLTITGTAQISEEKNPRFTITYTYSGANTDFGINSCILEAASSTVWCCSSAAADACS